MSTFHPHFICVACFQSTQHTGHDYQVTVTSIGQCCCGDESMIQATGFCQRHQKSVQLNNCPVVETCSLPLVFRCFAILFASIHYRCSTVHRLGLYSNGHRRFSSIVKVLSWIRKLTRNHCAVNAIMVRVLIHPFHQNKLKPKFSTAEDYAEFILHCIGPLDQMMNSLHTVQPPSIDAIPSYLSFLLGCCVLPFPVCSSSRMDRVLMELCSSLTRSIAFRTDLMNSYFRHYTRLAEGNSRVLIMLGSQGLKHPSLSSHLNSINTSSVPLQSLHRLFYIGCIPSRDHSIDRLDLFDCLLCVVDSIAARVPTVSVLSPNASFSIHLPLFRMFGRMTAAISSADYQSLLRQLWKDKAAINSVIESIETSMTVDPPSCHPFLDPISFNNLNSNLLSFLSSSLVYPFSPPAT